MFRCNNRYIVNWYIKDKGRSKLKWNILHQRIIFCGLVPGLSLFLKFRINAGLWFGVRAFEPDSAGIPELLFPFPLAVLFFLPFYAFTLKYETFCRPLQTSTTASCSHTWIPEKALLGRCHGPLAKVFVSDDGGLDSLCLRHGNTWKKTDITKKLLSTDLLHSCHSWAPQTSHYLVISHL